MLNTYLDADVYVTLRRRALATGEPMQELVREAVDVERDGLIEDMAMFHARASVPVVSLRDGFDGWESYELDTDGYEVEILESVIQDLEALPTPEVRSRIVDKLLGFETDPRPHNHERLDDNGCYRLRVGPYRLLFMVSDGARSVRVVAIRRRKLP